MATEQWYVKTQGYRETFTSLKNATSEFNKIKREIKEEEEGTVSMYYRKDGGDWELINELTFED